ncbi:hypothetical protein [Paenibacillus tianjinensis]|uniref:DUF4926 domain-containing protein n=1 Tax=Paenibacillus tianjinensis TaxID=2810347 RepID=A0ABX7L8V0_9BACL|nr:hypothetical protein [Paenibacillus tianjinensis]QSF43459.1 hypothetical protein JRJ22_19540 [Paenibacillus tianjinensis]
MDKFEVGSKVLLLETSYAENLGITGMTGYIIDEDSDHYDYAVEFSLTKINKKMKDFFNHEELALVTED